MQRSMAQSVGSILAPWLLLLVPLATALAPQLPHLKVSTITHYHLGQEIGTEFRDVIRETIASSKYFQDKILPYNATREGGMAYTHLLKAAETNLPQYLDEIYGMAFGSGVDFATLFLWNIQFEMELLFKQSTGTLPTPACSDLYVMDSPYGPVMGHNEDGNAMVKNTAYLVSAEIYSPDAQEPLDNFTAYCYPGELCGNAFGFNSKNLVFTVNAVFPKNVNIQAIPRTLLNRAVISLDYDTVADVLISMRCASGFSINIGDHSTNKLSNVEVSPMMAVQTNYTNGTGYHFNMYLHSDVIQRTDPSSVSRLTRVKELPPPVDIKDLEDILGDTENKQYPIFRTGTPPDNGATLATGIFDFGRKLLFVYHDNPHLVPPAMTLPMS